MVSSPAIRQLVRSPLPVFLLISVLLLVVHEPWRDEAQPWLIARDAPTPFTELDSEGSPVLWYLLIAPFAKLGLPFMTMRVLHLAFATLALAIVILRAPFTRLETWLFAFGYFVLYEYNAIARSYVLTLLLLVAIAALHARRDERPLLYAALLVGLANANGHGMILAAILGAFRAGEIALARRFDARHLAAAAFPLIGAGAAWLQMSPGPDLAEWRTAMVTDVTRDSLTGVAAAVLRATVPIGPPAWEWGATWIERAPELRDNLLHLGALVYLGSILLLWRTPRAAAIWILGSGAFLVVTHLKPLVSAQMRHHGLLFVLFVFCLWLAREERAPPLLARIAWPRHTKRVAALVIPVLLVVQALASLQPIQHDVAHTFSGGPDAAAYIRAQGYDDGRTFFAAVPAFIVPPVLAHLENTRTFYVPQYDDDRSYARWTAEEERTFHRPAAETLELIEEEARRRGVTEAILVTSFSIGGATGDPRVEELVWYTSLAPGDWVFVSRFTLDA